MELGEERSVFVHTLGDEVTEKKRVGPVLFNEDETPDMKKGQTMFDTQTIRKR